MGHLLALYPSSLYVCHPPILLIVYLLIEDGVWLVVRLFVVGCVGLCVPRWWCFCCCACPGFLLLPAYSAIYMLSHSLCWEQAWEDVLWPPSLMPSSHLTCLLLFYLCVFCCVWGRSVGGGTSLAGREGVWVFCFFIFPHPAHLNILSISSPPVTWDRRQCQSNQAWNSVSTMKTSGDEACGEAGGKWRREDDGVGGWGMKWAGSEGVEEGRTCGHGKQAITPIYPPPAWLSWGLQ